MPNLVFYDFETDSSNKFFGQIIQIGAVLVNDDLEDPITLPKERGQMCIFDTRTKHRVLPVTKGTRHTLVGWAIGPRWK